MGGVPCRSSKSGKGSEDWALTTPMRAPKLYVPSEDFDGETILKRKSRISKVSREREARTGLPVPFSRVFRLPAAAQRQAGQTGVVARVRFGQLLSVSGSDPLAGLR